MNELTLSKGLIKVSCVGYNPDVVSFRQQRVAQFLILILAVSNIIRTIGLIQTRRTLTEYNLLSSLNLGIIFAFISSIVFLGLLFYALKKKSWVVWATLGWMMLYTSGFYLLPAPNRLILRITLTLILLFALFPKRLKSASDE